MSDFDSEQIPVGVLEGGDDEDGVAAPKRPDPAPVRRKGEQRRELKSQFASGLPADEHLPMGTVWPKREEWRSRVSRIGKST